MSVNFSTTFKVQPCLGFREQHCGAGKPMDRVAYSRSLKTWGSVRSRQAGARPPRRGILGAISSRGTEYTVPSTRTRVSVIPSECNAITAGSESVMLTRGWLHCEIVRGLGDEKKEAQSRNRCCVVLLISVTETSLFQASLGRNCFSRTGG